MLLAVTKAQPLGELVNAPGYHERRTVNPHIVTSHVHDNDQTGDWHKLPGRGTIDWDTVMPELLRAPRLISIQAEADPKHDPFTIAELKACFDRLIKMA